MHIDRLVLIGKTTCKINHDYEQVVKSKKPTNYTDFS